MQIQKGIVKYKDRSDIICTYGLMEDGKQYYFLEGNNISNGNIVASTVLVEAIDPVVSASSIGVVDPNGNIVIPFANRSIKVISDSLLLVEKANSDTPSVVEANKLRSDPLAATKLVTTPAAIKEKINSKMGSEGRFVFNDQFSEATICDVNGKNLISNEYYSFIGFRASDNTLFLSKNVIDSPVLEFSVNSGMFVEEQAVSEDNSSQLDVSEVGVTQELIDKAMGNSDNKGFGSDDITAKDFESVVNETFVNDDMQESGEQLSSDVADENTSDGEEKIENMISDSSENSSDAESVEEENMINSDNEESDSSEVVTEAVEGSFEDGSEDVVEEANEEIEKIVSEEVSDSKDIAEEPEQKDELIGFDFGDNINYDVSETNSESDSVEKSLFDNELDRDIFADSKLKVDKIISDYDTDYNIDGTDTIIEDVASTMSELIKLNRSQRQKINAYEEKYDEIAAAHKRVVEKARSQVKDIDSLKNKIKNYETAITKLEGKVQLLEAKVIEQDRVISSQTTELETLRPQLEGKKELVKILADAQVLLDQAA